MKSVLLLLVSGFVSNAFAYTPYTQQMIEQLQFPGTRTCLTFFCYVDDKSLFEIVCNANELALGTTASEDVDLMPIIIEKMAQQGYHTDCSHSDISSSLFHAGAETMVCIHQK